MEKQTLRFVREKETPGTIRFKEVTEDPPVIGTLYVKKYAKPPDHLLVTIEDAPSMPAK